MGRPAKKKITNQSLSKEQLLKNCIETAMLSGPTDAVTQKFFKKVQNKKAILVDELDKIFKQKVTDMPFCTFIFNKPCTYYRCYDCEKHEDSCFCENCFQKGNHVNHRFATAYIRRYGEDGVCDCGHKNAIKPQGFCSQHSGIYHPINISKQQSDRFINFFTKLFHVLFLLYEKGPSMEITANFRNYIFEYLKKINQNSVYYNQLTASLMEKQINNIENKFGEKNYNSIIQLLFMKYIAQYTKEDIYDLIMPITYIPAFKRYIIQVYIQAYNLCPNFISQSADIDFYDQFLINGDQFDYYAKQGLLFYPKSSVKERDNIKTFYNRINFLTKYEHPAHNLWKLIIHEGLFKHFSEQCIDGVRDFLIKQFKDDKSIISTILKDIICQQTRNKTFDYEPIQNCFNARWKLFMYFLSAKLGYKPQMSELSIEFFKEQLAISKGTLIQFLRELIIQNCENDEKCFGFKDAILLFIHIANPKEGIIYQHPSSNELQKIAQYTQKIRQMLISILRQNDYFRMFSELHFPQQEFKQLRIKYLKAAMSDSRGFSREDLKNFFIQIGKFEGAQQVLKNCTVYDIEDEEYRYNGQTIKMLDVYLEKQAQINILEQIIKENLFIPSHNQKLCTEFIFDGKMLEEIIKVCNSIYKYKWGQKIHIKRYRHQINKRMLDIIVILDLLFEGKNPKITEFKENVKQSPELAVRKRNLFYKSITKYSIQNKKFMEIFSYLFQIEVESIKEEKQEQQQKQIDKAEIKRRKFEEMREKQNKIVFDFQSSSEQQEQHEICLLCRDHKRIGDELFSFAEITINTIFSGLIGSSESNINIKTCYHKIHKSCFTKSYGNLEYGICPLCFNLFNCIIPIADKHSDPKIIEQQQWKTRIQTYLSLNTTKFNQTSIFELLMHYLQFGISLLSLNFQQKQHKYRLTVNKSIMDITKYLYELDKNDEKKLLKNRISTLTGLQQKEKNQKIQINYEIKIFIVEILNKVFENRQIQHSQVKIDKLVKILSIQQFKDIMQNFQDNILNINRLFIAFEKQQQALSVQNPHIEISPLFKCPQLPENMQNFIRKMVFKCNTCNLFRNNIWQCFLCKQKSCQICCKFETHSKTAHKGCSLYLFYQKGQIRMDTPHTCLSQAIYLNSWQGGWIQETQPKKQQNPKQFFLKKSKYEDTYYHGLYNTLPSYVDKKNLVNNLNFSEAYDFD